MEQFLTKEGKTRSPIHEPLVSFDLVHGSLNGSLTPREGQPRSDSIIIPLNTTNKTFQFFDPARSCFLHPSIEVLRPSFTQHLKKCLEQLMHLLYVRRTLYMPRQIIFFFWHKLFLSLGEQPAQLSGRGYGGRSRICLRLLGWASHSWESFAQA